MALARFFVVAPRLLDEDLQRSAHMSLSAYTILLHLSEAPGRALRITELANRAYLSGSRTTRLVDESITDQLVTKERNAADGRGFDVTLTDEGLAALERAYPGSPAQRSQPRSGPRRPVRPPRASPGR